MHTDFGKSMRTFRGKRTGKVSCSSWDKQWVKESQSRGEVLHLCRMRWLPLSSFFLHAKAAAEMLKKFGLWKLCIIRAVHLLQRECYISFANAVTELDCDREKNDWNSERKENIRGRWVFNPWAQWSLTGNSSWRVSEYFLWIKSRWFSRRMARGP